jgi:hypothetical protein
LRKKNFCTQFQISDHCGGGGHSGKKAKFLCCHKTNIFFAILDNSKNILENKFFDLTSSQGTLPYNPNPIFALETIILKQISQKLKYHSFLSQPLLFRK